MPAIENIPIWTKNFLLICLANLLNSVGFYASMPVFPLLVQDSYGTTGLALGFIVGTYTVSAILTRPPAGYALDRFGRQKILYAGAIFFCCMYFLYPHAPSVSGLTLIRFLHGALWGVTMNAINTVVIDLLPAQRRGEGIGYFGLTMICGMALGPAIGTHVQDVYGFTMLFYLSGCITCLGFACIMFVRIPVVPLRHQPLRLDVLFEKTSLPISLTVLFMCIPYGTIMNFISIFARTIPDAQVPHFFLALALGTAIARIAAGRVFDRSGPSRVMMVSYTCLFAALCLLGLLPHSSTLPVAGFIYGLGFGISLPIFQAMINTLVPPHKRGAANATFMTSFDLGIFLGLLITSTLQTHLGWPGTYLSLAGSILISAFIFIQIAVKRYNIIITGQSISSPEKTT